MGEPVAAADSPPSGVIASGAARVAGVMGWPVRHSLSPRLHGYWLRQYRVDGAYVPLAVAPADFERCLRGLPALGFAGVNVTVPHKEAALAAVDQLSERARRIGAVNTVVVGEGGGLSGDNTDAFGLMENLADGAPGWNNGPGPAVILGAGGAARAVCVGLADAGVAEIRLVNRTIARAEALASDLAAPITVWPWARRSAALDGAVVLINATTLGMGGKTGLEIDLGGLPTEAVVCDIVYVPLRTPLLAAAASRGNRVVDGLGMLIHQARPGFAAWFGVEAEVSAGLRRFLVDGGSG